MKIYHLKRTQFLPISLHEAWDFFSTPKNLPKITPTHMGFRIVYISGDQKGIYPGQVIRYRVTVLPFYTTSWMTEITHVNAPYYFVDEQRFGPYSLWHHQHHFKEVAGGVEMTDEVNYAIPFGILGRMANSIFVAQELNAIFDYRFNVLSKLFDKKQVVAGTAS